MKRVSEITTQTLRFYRQQTQATKVDVTDLAESVLSLYQGRLHSNSVRVVRDYATNAQLLCFAGELRQVIANLVSNALDSMRDGGTLTVRLRDAVGSAGHAPSAKIAGLGQSSQPGRAAGVRVVVADTGTGIAHEVRRKIFEPFVTTKGETGTGLGLWVSSEILRKHEGSLRFRTCLAPGRSGTIFSLFLPHRDVMPHHNGNAENGLKAAAA